jgi:hypothetical protein
MWYGHFARDLQVIPDRQPYSPGLSNPKTNVCGFPKIDFSSARDITRDDCPASNLISGAIRKPLNSINIAVFALDRIN